MVRINQNYELKLSREFFFMIDGCLYGAVGGGGVVLMQTVYQIKRISQ